VNYAYEVPKPHSAIFILNCPFNIQLLLGYDDARVLRPFSAANSPVKIGP